MATVALSPGTFCTALLHTHDAGAAARHYQSVFGWDTQAAAGGLSFTLGGQRVAALRAAAPGVQGWVPYVVVEDVEATASLAARSGGMLVDGPESGADSRRRLIRDPDGAVLGLCGPGDVAAAELTDDSGSVWWMEVLTHVPDVLRGFYGAVLGWTFSAQPLPPHSSYIIGRQGGTPVGGILPIGPGWGTPPRWQCLFRVDDLTWSTAMVVEAGGTVEFGPLDVPSAGILTSMRDPDGALYVLMQPHDRSAA
jgi:predicted enzyme related to lactoylglutathione lyase